MNISLNRKSREPLHRQVESWLRGQIETGAFQPGEMLPSVKELCDKLGGINHQTVRMAMGRLTQEGAIYAIQGRGTFVKETEERQLKVALVLPSIDDEVTLEIARGVHDAFEEYDSAGNGVEGSPGRKAVVVMLDSRHSIEREITNIQQLEDMPLDGAIIFPVIHGNIAQHLIRLKADNFPVVFVDCAVPGLDFPTVSVDNYGGSYELTTHLLSRGRKRIAWIGNKKGFSSSAARYEGYRDALADFGLVIDRKLTFTPDLPTPLSPNEENLELIVENILKGAAGCMPDAIVCESDNLALSCIRILPAKGVSVPTDIAVVGFDDRREAAFSHPPLTTVRQDSREVGRRGGKMILDQLLDKSKTPSSVELPVSLVVRKSS